MILLTGFESFGGHARNPTALLMERFAAEPGVVTAVLPVRWDDSARLFAGLVERHRPTAALAFGLAFSTDRLLVERVALNLDDADLPDNAGERRQGRPIAPEAPVGLWSGLPVDDLVAALAAEGLPAAASAHAGTFVCNHLFFEMRRRHPALPAGFIHVPPLPEDVAGMPGRTGLALDAMEKAVRTMLAVVQKGNAG